MTSINSLLFPNELTWKQLKLFVQNNMINKLDSQGRLLIILAIEQNNFHMVRYLLNKGAILPSIPYYNSDDFGSIIRLTLSLNSEKALQAILESKHVIDDIQQSLSAWVIDAIYCNREDIAFQIVQIYLNNNRSRKLFNINSVDIILNRCYKRSMFALFDYIFENTDPKTFKIIDIYRILRIINFEQEFFKYANNTFFISNLDIDDTFSLLKFAIEEGAIITLQRLFQYEHIKPSIKNVDGYTLLHVATLNQQWNIIKLFLSENSWNSKSYSNGRHHTPFQEYYYYNVFNLNDIYRMICLGLDLKTISSEGLSENIVDRIVVEAYIQSHQKLLCLIPKHIRHSVLENYAVFITNQLILYLSASLVVLEKVLRYILFYRAKLVKRFFSCFLTAAIDMNSLEKCKLLIKYSGPSINRYSAVLCGSRGKIQMQKSFEFTVRKYKDTTCIKHAIMKDANLQIIELLYLQRTHTNTNLVCFAALYCANFPIAEKLVVLGSNPFSYYANGRFSYENPTQLLKKFADIKATRLIELIESRPYSLQFLCQQKLHQINLLSF